MDPSRPIRSRYVDTGLAFDEAAVFPFCGSNAGRQCRGPTSAPFPFPRQGSHRIEFPRFIGTMGRCDSWPHVSPHFVSFVWRYRELPAVLLPTSADETPGLELVTRFPTGSSRGCGQVSHVPGEPWCAFALFFDPGGTAGPGLAVQRHGPRASQGEGYPHCGFRGSITRLWRWLSTLRVQGRPCPTQDSLPAVASSTGRDWLPEGFQRKVSSQCPYITFPLSQTS